jgi:hypothetical protein
MLERIQDAPAHTVALRALGTVMAQDVEAAIQAALGPSSAASGLVVVIDPDFDGYLAELSRGLANAALAHRSLVKLAVVADAGRLDEARLSGIDVSAVPIRLFPVADRNVAFEWAAGARRGE